MKYFKRNGFVALVSMLSLAAYAEDILPLSVAGSETKEFIQASGYGIDTSNMIQQERIILNWFWKKEPMNLLLE